jgi:hypothetical protein
VQRWEYKVISLQDGRYTEALNEYARDGWELQTVVSDVHEVAPPAEKSRSLPMPGVVGRIEDAASKLNKLEGGSTAAPVSGTVTTILWVLRRAVYDD